MNAKAAKLLDDLEYLIKRFSTWVAFVATAAGAWYAQLTPDAQAALRSAYPLLVPLAPYLTGAAFILAALKKQDITTAGMRREALIDAFLDSLARQKAEGTLPPFVVAPHGVDPAAVAAIVAPKPAPDAAPPSSTDMVAAQLHAVVAPDDVMGSIQALHPLLTADQIRSAVAATAPAPTSPTA